MYPGGSGRSGTLLGFLVVLMRWIGVALSGNGQQWNPSALHSSRLTKRHRRIRHWTHCDISCCCSAHCSAPILNIASILWSSVWGLLVSGRIAVLSGNLPSEFTFGMDDSALCEFLGLCGILPVTYLAAPPRPGFRAGSRFAITVVERGMIVVSSSNSM